MQKYRIFREKRDRPAGLGVLGLPGKEELGLKGLLIFSPLPSSRATGTVLWRPMHVTPSLTQKWRNREEDANRKSGKRGAEGAGSKTFGDARDDRMSCHSCNYLTPTFSAMSHNAQVLTGYESDDGGNDTLLSTCLSSLSIPTTKTYDLATIS